MESLLEAVRPWNTHWSTGQVSPLTLKSDHERAAVPHLVATLRSPPHATWTVLAGPRQIGKTTSLGHVARRLLDDHGVEPRQVAIVPADQPAVQAHLEAGLDPLFQALFQSHAPSPEKPLYVLLDEVQEIPKWAKLLKAAWDRYHPSVRLLATGSSALHIIRPAEADFPGRVRVETIHPMKFREVVVAHPDLRSHLSGKDAAALEKHCKAARASIERAEPAAKLGKALVKLDDFLHASSPTLVPFLRQVFLEHCVWGGYPNARAGGTTDPARRRELFEQAWNAVLAKDVPAVGLVKTREFTLLFHHLATNPGRKFVPHNLSRDLGVKAETLSQWKRVLEDAMLVQQLAPLKPNLLPANGKDKAYLLDPGWNAYFTGVLDHAEVAGTPREGPLVETVLADHARRLQLTVTHSRNLPIGYVEDPEVDLAVDLGRRWLLVESKHGSAARSHLDEIDSPGALKVVATRDHFEVPEDEGALFLPSYMLALIC